ncbi:uncharacterized protein Z518_06355 [Rhinocladiella mackenziei CBS 650.93]|uniref:Heterokaryon incompatibility domain-containing protein n=1 Tax=Rhinocladiella mackenziei CBS 650.93 TaxID=1442369 RepID=A0A0D2H514_9EURO|nr:uncharacterized protein Z518_06355 [Rhinocladiella mackenziei CBS 650.93]KIX05483.1 hypothetical protein Z518_06355 [Rhinocladiella mackenziei CBS 650.93]
MATSGGDQASQARRHIETIRQEAGLDDTKASNRNVENLQNALHTLADELYQKSTHFLLELIQNADDNEYNVLEPSITLTYKGRRLRIDCNERGFSEKNVEAICRVGSSTKAGANRAASYVGEKGIGFKSVFKAADVVWISSNSYTFKFDKRQVLGMVAPIWEIFPEPTTPSMTSTLLQLSPEYDEKQLISDLKTFDSRMLMFLRRLNKVKITVYEAASTWETTLSKRMCSSRNETAIELIQDDKSMRYLVSSYRATNLPNELKRPGARESQIMLAFPDIIDLQPVESQKVYAFLPIRDYGFKFLLQADFLLSANREDILMYSPWNEALRREFVNAFVTVTRAYSHGQLCYMWPRYIPFLSGQSPFFEPARRQIITRLSREPVLKCRTQELMTPASLIYVPEEFCDKRGVPMSSSPSNDRKYLCPKYGVSLNGNLEALGMKIMTASIFLDHLDSFIEENASLVRNREWEWHTRLAELLLKLVFDANYRERILKLPVIPLNDGRWVPANGNSVYLPQEAERCVPPEGFELWLVREDAANHPTTRSLYSQLGLKVLSQESVVCNLIQIHMDESFSPHSMTLQQLISHATFLFNARADDSRLRYLWFVTKNGSGRVRGEQVYLTSQVPFAASHYFDDQSDVHFIHPDYLAVGGDDPQRWLRWLEKYAGMSILPRLTEKDPDYPSSFRLSPDFALIIRNSKSNEFLDLLKENWNHYSWWIEDGAGRSNDDHKQDASRERLRRELQMVQVQCRGCIFRPLREAFLPLPELVDKAQGQVPFVDVRTPLDSRWEKLKFLGLGVAGDVWFYLRCLEALSATREGTVFDKAVIMLEQIQARCSEHPDLVRKSFAENSLVCIPNKNQSRTVRWVKVRDCLWHGPECLRQFVALENVYPSCQRLFRDFFQISNAGIRDLVREAILLRTGQPLSYIRDLLLEIEKRLETDEPTTALDVIQTRGLWPVKSMANDGEWDTLGCAKNSTPWFIADRTHLFESFRGIVPLLAFEVEDILKMPLLLRKLGGDRRRLTRAATSIAESIGSTRPNLVYQKDLRSRSDFIARLIPRRELGKKDKMAKLERLEVFFTERVIQKWSLQVGSCSKQGRSKDGNVVVSTAHDTLKIYFKEHYFEENKTPGELIEAIASFCSIEDRHLYLLTIALTESPQRIHEWFRRHGIPHLSLDEPAYDIDVEGDFDPGFESFGSTNGALQPRGKTVFKSDLLRMFAQVHARGKGAASTSSSTSADISHIIVLDDGFSGLGVSDLYIEDDDDKMSVKSAADSTLSGRTLVDRTLRIFAIRNRMSRINRGPSDLARRDADDGLEFLGQKKVSQELQRMLGSAYVPETHWTSPLRTRNGHKPFVGERNILGKKKMYANFTLTDQSKLFTRYFAHRYSEAGKWIGRPPVYHLDVRTTKGGFPSEFAWSNDQMKMARVYTISKTNHDGIPSDVYFLVRVFNTDKKIEARFLLDPWSMYLADKMRVKADQEYRAVIHGS